MYSDIVLCMIESRGEALGFWTDYGRKRTEELRMPAGIVHALHGERIWEWLEKEGVVAREKLVKDAFDWGKQGPDFLFCHRFFPWQKGESLCELGGCLHREPPENILRVLQQLYQDRPVPMIRSYIMGFLCHYSLDRTCHPYIEWLSKKLLEQEPEQTEEMLQNEIESALDGIVLRWEVGKLPTDFSLGSCFPKNEEVEENIEMIYSALLKTLFGVTGKTKELRQAEKDARLAFRIMNDRTGLKKQLVSRLEKKGKRTISCHLRGMLEADEIDYANTGHEQWEDRTGKSHTEDFFQLFETAEQDTRKLLSRFTEASPEELAEKKYF